MIATKQKVASSSSSMNKVVRNEKLLNMLVNRQLLTEHGKAAVIAALDPFHDVEIEDLVGWPDQETAPSVVRRIAESVTVKSVADGGAISIMTYPTLQNFTMNHAGDRSNNLVTSLVEGATSTNSYVAPVVIRVYDNDTNLPVQVASVDSTKLLMTSIPAYLKAGFRVLGFGLEVHDVTAEIYKQGTLTVAEIEQTGFENPEVFFIRNYDDGTPTAKKSVGAVINMPTPVQGNIIQNQYADLASAVYMPGSVQWEAKKGCYIVMPFTGVDNFVNHARTSVGVYTTELSVGASQNVTNPTVINTSQLFFPKPTVSGSGDPLIFPLDCLVPMHSKQVLLTGLNANSTFTVNTVLYLEQFPTTYDPTLLTLARPSCPLDEMALEIISRATQELPVAVPVNENPLGEWFQDVVGTALEVLEPLGMIAFPEFAPLIGAGGQALKRMIKPTPSNSAPRPGKALPSNTQQQKPATAKQKKGGNQKPKKSGKNGVTRVKI